MPVTLESVQELVGRQLGRRGVKADDHLVADLGVESIDFLNLVSALEAKFQISIPSEEFPGLETVRDLYALVQQKQANR